MINNKIPDEITNEFIDNYTNKTKSELVDMFLDYNFDSLKNKIYLLPNRDDILSKRKEFLHNLEVQKLINQIKAIVEKGEFPKARDFKSREFFIKKYFGSFESLLNEAGIKIPDDKRRYFNREEIDYNEVKLKSKIYLTNFINKNRRLPINSEISKQEDIPHISLIYSKYNLTLDEFYSDVLGCDSSVLRKELFKENLLLQLKSLADKLGRSPTIVDLTELSKKGICPTASTYINNFESFDSAMQACGLLSGIPPGRKKNKEDMTEDLKKLSEELKRPLSVNDLKEGMASRSYYSSMFGSWEKACKEADTSSQKTRKFYVSKYKKQRVFSQFEYEFVNMLEENNINYLTEVYYKKVMSTERLFRFDFSIFYKGEVYMIEIFGLLGSKGYRDRINEKVELCNINNIPLLCFYPSSFIKVSELINVLESKITSVHSNNELSKLEVFKSIL